MSGTAGHNEIATSTHNETIAQLAARREQLKAEVAKLSALDDEARLRFDAAKPEMPEEIFVKGALDWARLDHAWFRPPVHIPGRPQTVPAEGWRAMLADPPRLFGGDEVDKGILERISAGLVAAERYEEAVRRACLETGYSAAVEAYEAAHDRLWALDDRILAMRAQSLDDLARQADVIRAHDSGDAPGEMIEALLTSIEALRGQAAA